MFMFHKVTQALVPLLLLALVIVGLPLAGAAAQESDAGREAPRGEESTSIRSDLESPLARPQPVEPASPLGGDPIGGTLDVLDPKEPDIFGCCASDGDEPWFAQLVTQAPAGIGICGAVRVSDLYVVTAAHCLTKLSMAATNTVIHLGDGDIAATLDATPTSFTAHPQWQALTATGPDLAVITIEEGPESAEAYPVLAARQSSPPDLLANPGGVTFDYHLIGRGPASPLSGFQAETKKGIALGMPDVPDPAAGWNYGCQTLIVPDPDVFCALFADDSKWCVGDSGGPVIDQDYLIGIASENIYSTPVQPPCGDPDVIGGTVADIWKHRCWLDSQANQTITWLLDDGTEQVGLPEGTCSTDASEGSGDSCSSDYVDMVATYNDEAEAGAAAAFAAATAGGGMPDSTAPEFNPPYVDTSSCIDELCTDEGDLVTLVAGDSELVDECAQHLALEWALGHDGNELICVEEYLAGVIGQILYGTWSGDQYPYGLAECLLGAQYCPNPWDFIPDWTSGMSGMPCQGLEGWGNPCNIFWSGGVDCAALFAFGAASGTLSWVGGTDCVISGAIQTTPSTQFDSSGTFTTGYNYNVELAGACGSLSQFVNCFVPTAAIASQAQIWNYIINNLSDCG